MIRGWSQWLEFYARFFVWFFGITLASLTVLQVVPALTEGNAMRLMILFYLFMLAALIVWCFDMYRLYPPRRRRAK